MNPMTNIKNIAKLSEIELNKSWSSSWHDKYKDSAWIFIGGLPFTLSEGDIIAVFSQYGEVASINLVRDKDTGKSRGFCFLCYEDQRSTVLAVDNLNGIKILSRTIRVDHVEEYKMAKKRKDGEPSNDNTQILTKPSVEPLIPKRVEIKEEKPEKSERKRHSKDKKSKKDKKSDKDKKKKKSKKRKRSRSSSSLSSSSDSN
ncbi:RNA-binding motif protein, X-linked 2 [Neocloeon triangulifer]|uniref:RNA-binding motif protein, X-linked 2 n=1 Tax=Neocloeon triangulifer TaxID=2078957 RepID=UPI00286FA847|nr:RNA-binding motif protein, X-linked 2 [Neocloeon triangulifer]